MEATQTICDVCGQIKGHANHWFNVVTDPWSSPVITFAPVTAHAALNSDNSRIQIEDICGEQCLHVRLTRWIAAAYPAAKQSCTGK